MARERTMKFARINIVTHPHTPDGYVRLIRQAFNSRKSIAVLGFQHLMIGELRDIVRGDPLQGMVGRIYRFTQIDPNATWFNVSRNDVATEEELAQISIPDNLRPNCDMFNFVFYPRGHAFYMESKLGRMSLSPGLVRKMLDSLFGSEEIVREFGVVEVNVFADREGLDEIFRIHQLSKLTIEVTKPNPDELQNAEMRVFGRMHAMKSRKLKMEIVAEAHESIEVDDEIRLAAVVAAAGNGKVMGSGFSDTGQRIEESTQDKPWFDDVKFDPNIQTATDALIAATARLPGNG